MGRACEWKGEALEMGGGNWVTVGEDTASGAGLGEVWERRPEGEAGVEAPVAALRLEAEGRRACGYDGTRRMSSGCERGAGVRISVIPPPTERPTRSSRERAYRSAARRCLLGRRG